MDNCLFFEIINGDIAAKTGYENEHIIAFNNIYQVAAGSIDENGVPTKD